MLVSFHKGFIMEGEASFKEKEHFWAKSVEKRRKIYLHTGIDGICDDSELEAEVDRLTNKCLAQSGWGQDFSGWCYILTREECIKLTAREHWSQDYVDTMQSGELVINTLDNWTVERAAKELNGKQFAQYCRDYGIALCVN